MADTKSLREWLTENEVDVKTFAVRVRSHWVTVYKWMRGTARPSFDVMGAIERETGGAVTARSLVGAHQAKHENASGEAAA